MESKEIKTKPNHRGHNLVGKTGGRAPEVPNTTTELIKEIAQSKALMTKISTGELQGPLAFLFEVFNDKKLALSTRIDAAKTVIKYTNKAMPTQVEQTVTNNDKTFEVVFK